MKRGEPLSLDDNDKGQENKTDNVVPQRSIESITLHAQAAIDGATQADTYAVKQSNHDESYHKIIYILSATRYRLG